MKFMVLFLSSIALAAADPIVRASPFAVTLFSEIFEREPSKNVIFSPASVYSCLGLAYIGAEGKTATEMETVLNLQGKTKEEVAQSYEQFLKKFENHGFSSDITDFKIANRIYVDQKYEVASKYNELTSKYFKSTAEKVNFAENTKTAEKINAWVAENTKDKIKDIVSPDSIDGSTSAVLVNAIYFKGHWKEQFLIGDTRKRDFFVSKTEKVSIDTMYIEENFQYADWADLDATALQLKYANTDIYMLIILPNSVDGLRTVEEKLKTSNLKSLYDSFSEQKVQVQLPKFKFEFDISLKDVLAKMGLNEMFSSSADFSSLLASNQSGTISDVQHKAFIEVAEYGTEASAATMIPVAMMGRYEPPGRKIYEFKVDHPFMFAIKDKDTVYFVGHVTNF